MMILYAPFARKLPHLNGMGSPKDYPWAEELANWLECDHKLVQVGGVDDKHLTRPFRQEPVIQ